MRILFGVIVLIVSWPAAAGAQCACSSTATCRGFLESDFVFTATVSGVRFPEPVVIPGEPTFEVNEGLATLAVGRVFRGIVPANVEVAVGGACDASFQAGQQYLVYGTSSQDAETGQVHVAVDRCSRTRLLAEAAADLALIESLNARRPEGSLYGEIIPNDPILAMFDDAPTYTIALRGNGRRYESTTTGGQYEFNALSPGAYELTIARGKDFELRLAAPIDKQACFDAGSVRVP